MYHEYIYSFTGCSFQNRKYFSFHALSYLQLLYITQVLKIQNMLVQFYYFIRITFLWWEQKLSITHGRNKTDLCHVEISFSILSTWKINPPRSTFESSNYFFYSWITNAVKFMVRNTQRNSSSFFLADIKMHLYKFNVAYKKTQ